MGSLLPTTSRAWAALAGVVAACAALAFTIGSGAAVTLLSAGVGLTLLCLGRVARRVDGNRSAIGQLRDEQRILRDGFDQHLHALGELRSMLEAQADRLTEIQNDMMALRLTVSQAASEFARHGTDRPPPP